MACYNNIENDFQTPPSQQLNTDPIFGKNYLLEKNLTSLALFGLWPFQSPMFLKNQKLRAYHYAFGLSLYCAFFLFLITEYVELFNVWGNLEDMTTNMSVSCLYTVGIMKIYSLFGKRQKLKDLIFGISRVETNIAHHQSEETKSILAGYVRRSRRVTYFFWTLTSCTILVFFVIPPVEYHFSSTYHRVYDNGTEYWSYVRPMIFSSWLPFDKYSTVNYFLAYSYQVLMGIVGAAYQAIWDTFIVSMMIHSIGQLQILQHNIENITNIDVKGNVRQDDSELQNNTKKSFKQQEGDLQKLEDLKRARFIDCINHHRYILKYSHDLNEIISPIMMLYFFVCSLMLCAIGFQASLYGFSIRLCFMLEYLCAMMIQLLLFYWHGNEVIHESSKVLQSTYTCDWYSQSQGFKKNLWIMREGMRKPVKYTVGKFYSMSLPTFLAILRASYSYFALLRQAQDKHKK